MKYTNWFVKDVSQLISPSGYYILLVSQSQFDHTFNQLVSQSVLWSVDWQLIC